MAPRRQRLCAISLRRVAAEKWTRNMNKGLRLVLAWAILVCVATGQLMASEFTENGAVAAEALLVRTSRTSPGRLSLG